MLTTTTPQLKRLSPQERLLASFESTDRMLQQFRLDDHEALKNAETRIGKPMTHAELIQRVGKLTHNRVWAEDSRNDEKVCGFYTVHDGGKKFLCAFDKGPLPEFSFIFTDAADLPIKEKRGWRTVLVRLLKMGVISWSEVISGFGDASHSVSSGRWNFNTREFRNK
jgi:hypothetical protein